MVADRDAVEALLQKQKIAMLQELNNPWELRRR